MHKILNKLKIQILLPLACFTFGAQHLHAACHSNHATAVIESNYNEIARIKRQICLDLEKLIVAVKNLKSEFEFEILKFLESSIKLIQEHRFCKAIETLNALKKVEDLNNFEIAIKKIIKDLKTINKICSKWLSDNMPIQLPEELSSIINKYALPYRDIALILESPNSWLTAVHYSPCGNYIASGSFDSDVKIWSVNTLQNIATFKGHTDSVNSLSYSPCGNFIASGSYDNTIRVWNIETQQEVKKLNGHTNHVNAISPCGKFRILGFNDNTVMRVFHIQTCTEVTKFKGHKDAINCVCFSPCGNYVASASEDKTIIVWDIQKKQQSIKFENHEDAVNSVCYSPCGKFLASGSDDKTVRIWDIDKKQEIIKFEGHNKSVNSVCFSSCGKYIASGSYDETIRIWGNIGYN